MLPDSIVEETRAIRDEYARQLNYDVRAIHRDLKAREQASGRKFVSFPPREIPAALVPADMARK